MPRSRLGPRVVLAAGLGLGIVFAWYTWTLKPAFGVNFRVYRTAAQAALSGQPFYGVVPPGLPDSYVYLYPPVTVAAFVPFALLPSKAGYALFTLLSIVAGASLAVLCGRYVERFRSLSPLDYLLFAGFTLASPLAVPSLVYGNVNVVLAFLVGASFFAYEAAAERSERAAGTALALAAVTKVFPAGFGIWYLRERARVTLTWGVGTGVALALAGVLAFGVEAHVAYVTEVLLPRLAGEGVAAGGETYVTVRRPLSVFVPDAYLSAAAAAVLAPVVAATYRGLDDRDYTGRLLAILATLAAVTVFVPSYPLYLLFLSFPLLPALYLVDHRVARPLLLVGALLVQVAVQADDLLRLVEATGVPPILLALRPVFEVATPPLWGVISLFAGCLAYRYL